jgi:5-methylcytosine-specific restriction endonuclease McrA
MRILDTPSGVRHHVETNMEQALLLNASYEPLKVVDWQKAVTLWCQGKVEVIAVHDREIRAVSFTFRLPSVIRLLRFVKIKRRFDYVPFSRANIYARDNHTCQYCDESFPTSELTFDHVVPVAQAAARTGRTSSRAACPCNRRKGGRTPAEAGMRLQHGHPAARPPHPPSHTVGPAESPPESWRDYLYWNMELDES